MFSRNVIKLPLSEEKNDRDVVKLSGGIAVEDGGEMDAEVGYGVEGEIDVGVGMLYGVELVLLLELGLKFVSVMEFVQDGAMFKLGSQVGVVKLRWSS
jgi:hypothetical protein